MCSFSPLSNTVYEWVGWMWRMSERSGCGQYLKRIFIFVCKKILLCVLLCIDDKCRNMSLTSESEGAEQIWSGWSKFGVADVGRTVWRVARYCVIFYFRGQNF